MNPPQGTCPICGSRVDTVSMSKDLYTGLTGEFTCASKCSWTTNESRIMSAASGLYTHINAAYLLGRTYETKFDNEQLTCHLVELPPIPKDIVAEPILAWRIWNVVVPTAITIERERIEKMQREMREGYDPFSGLLSPSLQGVGHTINWDGPVHHATCEARIDVTIFGGPVTYANGSHHPVDHVPAENCTCGVWALKTRVDMMGQLGAYFKGQPMAYGQVHLWGRIFEHEKGYRGEYAKPVSLTIYDAGKEVADALAEKYGCVVLATDVALPAAKTYDPFQYLASASSAYANYYIQAATMTSAQITKAIGDICDVEFAKPPTLREKLRHPWTKGPLQWMYDPMRDIVSDGTWFGWTLGFREPFGFSLWCLMPVTVPLYYLKRALTSQKAKAVTHDLSCAVRDPRSAMWGRWNYSIELGASNRFWYGLWCGPISMILVPLLVIWGLAGIALALLL